MLRHRGLSCRKRLRHSHSPSQLRTRKRCWVTGTRRPGELYLAITGKPQMATHNSHPDREAGQMVERRLRAIDDMRQLPTPAHRRKPGGPAQKGSRAT